MILRTLMPCTSKVLLSHDITTTKTKKNQLIVYCSSAEIFFIDPSGFQAFRLRFYYSTYYQFTYSKLGHYGTTTTTIQPLQLHQPICQHQSPFPLFVSSSSNTFYYLRQSGESYLIQFQLSLIIFMVFSMYPSS